MELDVTQYNFTRTIWADAPPAFIYDLITDVSRIGDWSPNASAVAYDDGEGPRAGSWFSGRNTKDGRTWTSRSQVVAAVPGRRFSFVVGGAENGIVRWDWDLHPSGGRTGIQQSWRLLRADPVLGETPDDLRKLRDYMADSAEKTLRALTSWIAANYHPVPELDS